MLCDVACHKGKILDVCPATVCGTINNYYIQMISGYISIAHLEEVEISFFVEIGSTNAWCCTSMRSMSYNPYLCCITIFLLQIDMRIPFLCRGLSHTKGVIVRALLTGTKLHYQTMGTRGTGMEHCDSYDLVQSENAHLTLFEYILVLLKAPCCRMVENLIASFSCKTYLVIGSVSRFPDHILSRNGQSCYNF